MIINTKKNKKIQRSSALGSARFNGFTPLEVQPALKQDAIYLANPPAAQFCKKRKSNSKLLTGFTLIELLVAVSIFLVVITMAAEIFMMGMGGVRRLYGRQNALDSARFIMESMAKEIRMSTITSASGDSTTLDIKSSKLSPSAIQYVFTAGGGITRSQGGGPASSLNPAEVQITGGRFIVGKYGTTLQQPRVTIIMGVRNVTAVTAQQVQINLQTTISSREYGQ